MDQTLISLLELAYNAGANNSIDKNHPTFEQWKAQPTISQILRFAEIVDIRNRPFKIVLAPDAKPPIPSPLHLIRRIDLQTIEVPKVTDSIQEIKKDNTDAIRFIQSFLSGT